MGSRVPHEGSVIKHISFCQLLILTGVVAGISRKTNEFGFGRMKLVTGLALSFLSCSVLHNYVLGMRD